MAYVLHRNTAGSKLLARYEYDNASFPFATADWTPFAGNFTLSGGALVYTGANAEQFNGAHRIGSMVRSSTFVQAVIRAPAANYPSINVHVDGINITNFDAAGMIIRIDGTSLVSTLREYVNSDGGGAAGEQTTAAQVKSLNTDYRVSVHGNGTAIGGYDFGHAGNHLTRTANTRADGKTGLYTYSTAAIHVRRWFECTSRYVTVTAVPTGGSVEVRKADDTVLATGTESGGSVSISMHDVPLEQGKKLVVKDSGDTILATYTAAGGEIIEPGETYNLSDWLLQRSTPDSKLLARHEHDNGSYPFWSAYDGWGSLLGMEQISGKKRLRRLDPPTAWRWAEQTYAIAARSKTFVYCEYEAEQEATWFFLGSNVTDITADSHDGVGFFAHINTAGPRQSGIGDYVNSTGVALDETNPLPAAKVPNTVYAASSFSDGTAVRAVDYHANETYTGTCAARGNGVPGLGIAGADGVYIRLSRYIVATDRFTTVTGVPAGGSAEVRTAADVVLASASESGGTASINMEFSGLQTAVKLVVKDSGDTILATYDASLLGEIIEPGETYIYESSAAELEIGLSFLTGITGISNIS